MSSRRLLVRRLALVAALVVAGLLPLLPDASRAAAPAVAADLAQPRAARATVVTRGARATSVRPRTTVLTAGGREAVAGRLIVGLRGGAGIAARADVHRQASARGAGAARVVAALTATTQVVDVSGAASLEAAAAAYRADSRVRYAEPDYILRAFETPSDTEFGQQWGMTQIGAPAAWDVSHGASARRIAILDCGIFEEGSSTANGYPGHPDINGKVVARQDFTGSSTGSDDYCDHGTHVAGIAAARTNNGQGVAGVGYETRLMNGKVLDDLGSGSTSEVIQGIYWAADNGANVINMSLGAEGACSSTFQDAITYAWASNVVVVAAAGNDNLSTPHQPAGCANVVAVGSTDADGVKSSFSAYGAWVDVAAPGGFDGDGHGILSTDYAGDYVYKAGTSMAAPHVAGLAGLLWGTDAFTTARQVVDRLTATADPVAGTGVYWQYGRINAAAALAGLGGVAPSPTATATAPGGTPTATATAPASGTATATPPATSGATTWYFAEGYTGPGFDEYLTILNPNATAAAVAITYYLSDGPPRVKSLTVAAQTRTTVAVHDTTLGVGRGKSVAAKVESTNGVGIVAERPMYFRYSGDGGAVDGGHTVLGATATARSWYFAEGYTGQGFDEYLTILNPNGTAAPVAITYYLSDGTTREAFVTVGATSRATVAVHDLAQGVGRNQEVSARVTTTQVGGIVVERPMYFTYGGTITGGHTVMGATAPAPAWYFAEGYTGQGFDEYLTILNPGDAPAPVAITYYLSDGTTRVTDLTVTARTRATVGVHDASAGVGRGQEVSARVTTTSPDGIVVERPMYFAYSSAVNGGHDVLGATAPARTWTFAEGYTAPGFDEYLTILNPSGVAAPVTITYYLGNGATQVKSLTVGGNQRATVVVHETAQGVGRGQEVAARVATTSADGIVVERPSYFRYSDAINGGHDVMGASAP